MWSWWDPSEGKPSQLTVVLQPCRRPRPDSTVGERAGRSRRSGVTQYVLRMCEDVTSVQHPYWVKIHLHNDCAVQGRVHAAATSGNIWETTVWLFWNNYKSQTTPVKRLHDALTYTAFDRIKYYRLNNWISNQDMQTFSAAAVRRLMINKSLLEFLFSLHKKYVYCFCKALTIEYTKVRENCRFWMKKGWHTDLQYPIVLL